MTKTSLTDLAVRKLPAKDEGRYDVWDARVPGLGVRVFSSGVKSFFLSHRLGGKKRRDTLGRYPVIGLAEARGLAYERRAKIARGEDVVERRDMQHLAFQAVLEDFITLHCKRHNKPSTLRSTRRLLEKEFLPTWKNRDVTALTKGDILKVLDAIVERGTPGAANHAYAAISKFFSWCTERDIVDGNLCAGIKRPAKLNARDRVLSDKELARVWQAATEYEFPFGSIVRFLMLTAQRRGEVANMAWAHIDFERAVWNIPKEMTKSSRAYVVPLTPTVVSIIDALPRLHEELVFPARGLNPTTTFSGFGKCKERLDQVCQVSDWTLHDLRRTAATGMAELGVAPHVVERVLNHSSGTFAGVAGVYNRFGYLDEMRDALVLWEGKIQDLAAQQPLKR